MPAFPRQFDALLVDDSSRLSRDNQHVNTLLCLFRFWGISLISVSDGLDLREEHAKVAYQFRAIINELYLTDLKKKTHRGQMGRSSAASPSAAAGTGHERAGRRADVKCWWSSASAERALSPASSRNSTHSTV